MSRTHDRALAIMFNKPATEVFRDRVNDPLYKTNLTEEQRVVEQFTTGRALVQAGPGSGKTATGVAHVRHVADTIEVSTFHSYMMRDIYSRPQDFGFRRRPRLETGGYFRLMNEATNNNYRSWDDSQWDDTLISWVQNTTHTKHLAALGKNEDETAKQTLRDVAKMRKWMLARDLMTFDDVLRLYAEERNTEWLETHRVADHIFVDEFQDVNPFQLQAVLAMSRSVDTESLVCVGDRYQSIYTFRGAVPESFELFEEAVPSVKKLYLSKNFRSKDEIIGFYNGIFESDMVGHRGSDVLSVRHGFDVASLHPFEDAEYKQCAILCRYNKDVVGWQLSLTKAGIPSNSTGRGDFWKLKHVKMALGYRGKGGWESLRDDWKWRKMLKGRRFQDDDGEQLAEVMSDAKWVLRMSDEDLKIAQNCLQNKDGIVLSTIHKSKGAEWKRVLIHNCDERLVRDKFVFYVAASRAEDFLTLG